PLVFFPSDAHHRALHSFPTRRSSDLSIPRLGDKSHKVRPIKGIVSELHDLPPGCSFSTRCPLADEYCGRVEPELEEIAPGHLVADRKSTRLNSSHVKISYAVFCLKKK